MWTLVITAILSGASIHTTVIEGFKSSKACMAAGETYRKAATESNRMTGVMACVTKD